MGRHTRETLAQQHDRVQKALSGSGKFVFENNTKGDLYLPKDRQDSARSGMNRRMVRKGERFVGDDYFMFMVKSHELRLIEEVKEVVAEKLITEQPPVVTHQGAVEYVQGETKFNEQRPAVEEDVLLTEEPLGGVKVVLS